MKSLEQKINAIIDDKQKYNTYMKAVIYDVKDRVYIRNSVWIDSNGKKIEIKLNGKIRKAIIDKEYSRDGVSVYALI